MDPGFVIHGFVFLQLHPPGRLWHLQRRVHACGHDAKVFSVLEAIMSHAKPIAQS